MVVVGCGPRLEPIQTSPLHSVAPQAILSRIPKGIWDALGYLPLSHSCSSETSKPRRFLTSFFASLLTRLFATLSAKREQGPHSRPHGRLTRYLQARLTLSGIRVQWRESSRKSRENHVTPAAVPTASRCSTPPLADKLRPQLWSLCEPPLSSLEKKTV
jgi:hypothetical protein